MTLDSHDIFSRKAEILRLTVDQYISSVTPVSSARIAQSCALLLSSATIRNILAELEQEGYLTHPHTSAGRVPTQKGYRFYVDHFVREIQLLEEEKARIKAEYLREKLELDRLLETTSKVLSDMTQYMSFISVDGWENKLFYGGTSFLMEYPDYHDLNSDIVKIKNILSTLDEKQKLLEIINRTLANKVDILIGQEMECANINECSLVVSQYKSDKGMSGRIAILGPTRMDYNRVVSAVDYFSNLIEEMLEA